MSELALKRDKTLQTFDTVFADMLAQFPQEEMKPKEIVRTLLERGRYHLLLAYDGDQWVGYLIVYYDRRSYSLWLDYFAVFAPFHSKGYGSRMLALLPTVFPYARGCFLEVEKPASHNEMAVRRAQFYRRQGARRLSLDYIYPCVEGVFPMDLFFIAYTQEAQAGLSADDIFGTIARVFKNTHSDLPHVGDVLRKIRRNLKRRERMRKAFLQNLTPI